MPKRFFDTLEDFKNNLHRYDASLIDYLAEMLTSKQTSTKLNGKRWSVTLVLSSSK